MKQIICRHLFVTGRVQGVWYRGAMVEEAERLGVRGWVRNLSDGRVEAIVEGAPEAVEAIVAWCRRGPRGAEVADLDVKDESPGGFAGFEIDYRGR